MKPRQKLTSRTREQEQQSAREQTQQHTAIEFTAAEELLRHDALHTPVPPSIESRLQQTLKDSSPSAVSWWRRLFKR